MGRIQGLTAEQKISIVENAPYPMAQGAAMGLEGYGELPTFQPRIQPQYQGYSPPRGILFSGWANRVWGLLATNNLIVRVPRPIVRGLNSTNNLNTPAMPYPVAHGHSAGTSPSHGIYTGVKDDDY